MGTAYAPHARDCDTASAKFLLLFWVNQPQISAKRVRVVPRVLGDAPLLPQ